MRRYGMRTSDFFHYYGNADVAYGSLVNPVNELGFRLSNPQEVVDTNGEVTHYTVEATSELFNGTRHLHLEVDSSIVVQVDPVKYEAKIKSLGKPEWYEG
jgi:hypothetical protein